MATNNNFTTEQLLQGLELDNQLKIARGYDKAEKERGDALGYTPDYSFGLNALGGGASVPKAAVEGLGVVPHFTDSGKLPNHITFSDQAVLGKGNPLAGSWVDRSSSPTGEDTYYPTAAQLKQPGYLEGLQKYYNWEKGNGIDKVIVPPPFQNIKQ